MGNYISKSVIMKDLTERTVVIYADETSDGSINTYHEFADGDNEAVDLDEIMLWKKKLEKIRNYEDIKEIIRKTNNLSSLYCNFTL